MGEEKVSYGGEGNGECHEDMGKMRRVYAGNVWVYWWSKGMG